MILTLKEMELLCIFYNGTRAQTVDLLRHAAKGSNTERTTELTQLANKLETLPQGATVCLAFAAD